MAGQNNIKFGVSFETDQSLKKLEQDLSKVLAGINQTKRGNGGILTPELQKAADTAKQLSNILDQCYNKDLGSTNITKFNQLLTQSHINLEQVKRDLASIPGGADAFNNLGRAITSSNLQLQQGNKLLNEMATTMASAAKWSVAYGIMNQLTDTISNAYTYVKQLDTSLTEIRIVTGDSANEMGRFAEQANTAAKNLGSNTLDYTKSALAFYQQGLDDEAVANRTEATIKAANATGANAQEVAENLTAVWNGFQAAIGTETEYVDKLAAVADSSASNLNELATAMSKVASVANNVGVDMDQLTAQISTIIATTRQAPETVGNALKTIYARINDIKAGSDDAEMSLGNYTGKMEELGISVLDSTGHLRDTGDVMEEIGSKWGTMTREQQIYLAQVMAGQRQMNNMVALFDNWTQYSDMLNVSLNAQGALDEKNARYMESTQAHLNELKSTYQDLYSTLINTDELNTSIDAITNAIQVVDNFLEGFGGGIKSVMAFGTIVAYVFRDQIGNAINQAQRSQEMYQQNLEQMALKQQAVQLGAASGKDAATLAAYKEELALEEQILAVKKGLTQEEYNELNAKKNKIGELEHEIKTNEITIEQLEKRVDLELQDTLTNKIANEEKLTAEEKEQLEIQEKIQSLEQKNSSLNLQKGSLKNDIDNQTALAESLQHTRAQTELLTSSMMLMTTTIGTISTLTRTWTDENTTLGEKMVQTFMSLGFAIPMVVTGYKNLSAAITALSTLQNAETAGIIANTASVLTNAAAKAKEIALRPVSIGFKKAEKVETVTLAAAETGLAAAEGAAAAAATTESMALFGLYNMKRLLNGQMPITIGELFTLGREALPGATSGIKLLTGATAEAGTAMAGFTAPLIAFVGVAAGVALACYGIAKAYDYQKDRAEAATQAATQAKNKAAEIAEEYTNLKTSLDQLKDSQSALNGLTKGTLEWKEAVLSLNEQILQLLDKYPQLAKYLNSDENGVLSLDPAAYDDILNEQMDKAKAAQDAALTQQANATREQGLYEAQKYGRESGVHGMSPEKILQAAQIYAQHSGEIITADDKVIAFMQAAQEENLIFGREQAAAMLDNTEGLRALNTTAQTIETLEANKARNALGDNESYNNSKYQADIDKEYQKRYNAEYNKLRDQYLGGSNKEGTSYTKEELASMYQRASGIAIEEDQLKEMTKSEMADMLASYEATHDLAEQTNEIIREGEKAGKKAEESMTAFEKKGQEVIDKFNGEIVDPTNNYKDQQEAIEGIGEDGKVSAEDATTLRGLLTSAGKNFDDYFTKMADGSYQLIGKVEEFKKEVNSINLDPFKEQVKGLLTEMAAVDNIEKHGGKRGLVNEQQTVSGQQAQVDYLAAQGFDDNFVGEMKSAIENGGLNAEQIKQVADACKEVIGNYDEWIAKEHELKNTLGESQQQLANGAQSIEELNQLYAEGLITQDQYNEALKAHGANADVNKEYVQEFTEVLSEQADTLDWVDDSLQDNEEAATALAASIEDAIEGVEEIQEKWEEWNEQGLETPGVIEEITDVLSDMFNTDIDSDFVKENLEDIERLANGDISALNDLQQALALDTVDKLEIPAELNTEQFQNDKNQLLNEIAATDFGDIQVGAEIDTAPFYSSLQAMIEGAQMTTDQIANLYAGLGYDPEISYKTITVQKIQQSKSNGNYEIQYVGLNGETETAYVSEEFGNGIQQGDTITIPVIKGAKFANKAAGVSNLGGNRTTPKGNGGGGGGGGGGKQNKPAEKKKVKKDPYHDVNDQLKEVAHNLKLLQKEEKFLTGKEYLENLRKQNQELQTQIKLSQKKIKIAQKDRKSQMKEMQEEFGNIFSTDEAGHLTNFVQIQKDAKKQVDKAYKTQLKNPTDENKDRYEYLTKRYNDLTQAMEDYTKAVDTIAEMEEDIKEIEQERIENSIKMYKSWIDAHIDFSDLRKKWKEFQRDVIEGIKEDDYVNQASFNLSFAKDDLADAKELLGFVNDLQTRIANMQNGGWDGIYGYNQQQAYEDLQKYMEELMDRGEDLADQQEEIRENWLDAIDAAKDAFDDNIENFDDINDILEHNLDMLDMLYGDAKFDQAAKLYELQARNSMNSISQLIQQRNFWKTRMDNAVVGTDVWKEYRDNWKEAIKDVNDAVEDSAKFMYDAYEAQINNIAEKLRNALYGGNADLTSARWEHYKEDTDRYLDSIQRGARGLSLINKYNDALNGKSLKQQKEIQKLQKAQLDNLNNQTEVRQIDYDIAEKELELLLKQQALEDARDNKTKLRLRRDSQGNYRYQYVADQEQISQAERELAETAAELYELSRQDYYDTVNYIQEITDEYLDRQKEIMTEYANDEQKRNELLAELATEQAKRIATVGNDYEEMSNKLMQHTAAAASVLDGSLGGQLQEFINMPDDIYEAFAEVFAPDGEIIALVDGLASNVWQEGFAKMPEAIKKDIFDSFGLIPQQLGDIVAGALDFTKISEGLDDMLKANQQYQTELLSLQELANQNFDDLSTNMADTVIATEKLILDNNVLMNQYGSMINTIAGISNEVDKLMNQFRSSGAEAGLMSGLGLIAGNAYYLDPTDPNAVPQQVVAGNAGYNLYGYLDPSQANLYGNLDSVEEIVTQFANNGGLNNLSQAISSLALQAMSTTSLDNTINRDTLSNNSFATILKTFLDAMATNGQDVTINADFPGITAAVELETALTNLANQASQVASGNRRNY